MDKQVMLSLRISDNISRAGGSPTRVSTRFGSNASPFIEVEVTEWFQGAHVSTSIIKGFSNLKEIDAEACARMEDLCKAKLEGKYHVK